MLIKSSDVRCPGKYQCSQRLVIIGWGCARQNVTSGANFISFSDGMTFFNKDSNSHMVYTDKVLQSGPKYNLCY